MKQELINEIAKLVRTDIVARRAQSVKANVIADGGGVDDFGASELEELLDTWCAGLRREVPEVFQNYYYTAYKQADPEYMEYLRLKKKFG